MKVPACSTDPSHSAYCEDCAEAALLPTWQTLDALRPGAVFVTEGGILAMKTEYHTFESGTQWNCYLLASGESAHFPNQDTELVREIVFQLRETLRKVEINPIPPEMRTLACENASMRIVLQDIHDEAADALGEDE